jgi:hypothetical protein
MSFPLSIVHGQSSILLFPILHGQSPVVFIRAGNIRSSIVPRNEYPAAQNPPPSERPVSERPVSVRSDSNVSRHWSQPSSPSAHFPSGIRVIRPFVKFVLKNRCFVNTLNIRNARFRSARTPMSPDIGVSLAVRPRTPFAVLSSPAGLYR